MSPNQRDRRRDLSKNWCPEGESFSSAARRVSQSRIDALHHEFADAKPGEPRAAILLHVFTDLDPTNADRQIAGSPSGDGVVDVLLTSPSAPLAAPEIAEITSSYDTTYEASSANLSKFEKKILQTYQGHSSWKLDLNGDWHREKLMTLAPKVAKELTHLDQAGTPSETTPLSISPHVDATRCATIGAPTVQTWSRSAGVADSEEPYLEALSCYLSTDTTIQKKLKKLNSEKVRHDASRVHLFISMASTGPHGALLPTSPSYFTEGTFTAPAPLTDLWLEGNTGALYHWSDAAGWIFHSLTPDDTPTD
ncbi:hypothetical protein [Pseudoclavibacter terrae]|uniref:Uncharacterized protein n=1 Tax=Pseudoclavibacter terrae TaxID=1530195 RepID=A0A7J5AXR5_9MICO|nr:hypothetical protein [Pseudoclavibacter terrae]KAB1636124.1 hypothetical protein F8O03_17895 [Pseudoclavibacter terrae]